MANGEQLAILKESIETWNQWRAENPDIEIDLSEVDFNKIDLKEANLRGANLSHTKLGGAYIARTNFIGANLREASLNNLLSIGADFSHANLCESKAYAAYLRESSFKDADLNRADFGEAALIEANLSGAYLYKTNFKNGIFLKTILGNNNLEEAVGLETIRHQGPSTIGLDTIRDSKGKIPVEFLRGCGLSDLEIEYARLYDPGLSNEITSDILQNIYDLKANRPIQISPLFISYSHANMRFVEKLESKFTKRGIRFWRDVHNATAGRLETQIDRAIRHNPTVLLVLSENSTKSDWVEHEVRLARKLEKETGRDVLCPIALDDSWKTSRWSERIVEQVMEYNILDFSKWDDDTEFSNNFNKLIDGLDMFYKK